MAANPNPARITAASWWLMEQLLALEPGTANGGIWVDFKPGYHADRNTLLANSAWRNDYSIKLAADKLGPSDKGAGYDWTFRDAQAGKYANIIKYGDRIEAAYKARDERLSGWREVLIQADPDLYAEGFDFQSWTQRTPDSTHLWHMHASELRQHLDSYDNKRALLSVLAGQTLDEWKDDDMTPAQFLAILRDPAVAGLMKALPWQYVGGGIPTGMSTLKVFNDTHTYAKAAAGALPPDLAPRLAAILAAALDDADTTVVLPPEAIAELTELLPAIEAAAERAVREAFAGGLAPDAG